MTLNEIVMEINEVNKKLYESAFVSDGTFGDIDNWKPDIDERLIEVSCEDEDGNWIPATPLGYRDYKISRAEGLNNILSQDAVRIFTYEDIHTIRKEDNILKQYDKITINKDGNTDDYIVINDDETRFYVIDETGHLYYVDYIS